MEAIDKELAATGGVTDSTDTTALAGATKADTAKATDTSKITTPEGEMTPEEFAKKHPFFTVAIVNPQQCPGEAIVAEENKDKVRRILERDDIQRLIPTDMQFLWSAKPAHGLSADGKHYFTLYPVKSTPNSPAG